MAQIDAQLAAAVLNLLGMGILAHGGHHQHPFAKAGQVFRDVAAHAAQCDGHAAGIAVRRYQCAVRRAADIHVHRAYHCHIGALTQQVTAPADQPLAHQVGDMHRHRGARNARPLRQLLLGDQRIITNPCQDFLFASGHVAPRLLSIYLIYTTNAYLSMRYWNKSKQRVLLFQPARQKRMSFLFEQTQLRF